MERFKDMFQKVSLDVAWIKEQARNPIVIPIPGHIDLSEEESKLRHFRTCSSRGTQLVLIHTVGLVASPGLYGGGVDIPSMVTKLCCIECGRSGNHLFGFRKPLDQEVELSKFVDEHVQQAKEDWMKRG